MAETSFLNDDNTMAETSVLTDENTMAETSFLLNDEITAQRSPIDHPDAGVKVDSELMMMLEGAIPVPSTSRFVAVLDDAGRPIVFSIGNDNKFYCIKLDAKEIRRVYDLGAYFYIRDAVVAMYVTQGKEGTLYIAFATDHNVYLVEPIKPKDINPDPDSNDPTMNLVKTQRVPSNIHIMKIIINDESEWRFRNEFPRICIIYREGSSEARKVGVITYDDREALWFKNNCALPDGTTKIMDITPARVMMDEDTSSTVGDEGIFALCIVNNSMKVVLTGVRKCLVFDAPAGATAIDMYIDKSGYSRCVVGGKGLWVIQEELVNVASHLYCGGASDKYNKQQKEIEEVLVNNDRKLRQRYQDKKDDLAEFWLRVEVNDISQSAKWTKISSDPLYDMVDNLFIAQVQDSLSIWFESGNQILCYQQGSVANSMLVDNEKVPPVPLLPDGRGAEFAAVLDPKTKSQIVIVANKDGGLTLLEQASDTRLWKETPFNIPSMDHNVEFMSYNTRITITGKDGLPVIHQKFILGCSSWLYCSVNGRCKLVTRDGIEAMTDECGAITIINRTADVSSYHFFLQNAKAAQTFANLSSLLNSHKETEIQSFLTDFTRGSKEIAQGSVEALTGQFVKGSNSVLKGSVELATGGFGLMKSFAKSAAPAPRPRQKEWYQRVWDWFGWVVSKAKEVVDWVVERVEDAWRFIVKIGKTVLNFVIETVIQVQKVYVFIFEKIGIAVQTAVKWLGFLFSWGDIVETSKGIANMTNSFFDWAIIGVGKGANLIDQKFNQLETTIRKAAGVPDTSRVKSRLNSLEAAKASGGLDYSAAVNIGRYHYQHSGVHEKVDALQVTSTSGDMEVFKNKFIEEMGKLKARLDRLGQVWEDYFTGKKQMTVGDFFKTLGVEILLLILDAIKGLLKAIVSIGVGLITSIKEACNMTIKVPILSPVFRLATRGQDLTVINALSLLLAIPTTILAKMVTNERPAQINRKDFREIMVTKGLTDESLKAYYELSNYVRFSHFLYKGIKDVWTIYKSRGPANSTSIANPMSTTKPTEPSFSLFSLVLPVFGQVYGFPVDHAPPMWDVRMTVWGIGTATLFVKPVIEKLGLGDKGAAVYELMVVILNFAACQCIHDAEYNASTTTWKDKDTIMTDLSVSLSVFELLENVATATGIWAPELKSKTGLAAGTALTTLAVCGLQVGKIVHSHKKGDFKYSGPTK